MFASLAAILASLGAGTIAKLLGLLGSSFLKPVLDYLNSKGDRDVQKTSIFFDTFKSAMQAEVQTREIASKERIALWGDLWYKSLIVLIVAPPAIYSAAVFADSIFIFPFDIDAAPARFETLGFDIMKTFIYGGSFAGGVIGAAKMFIRR